MNLIEKVMSTFFSKNRTRALALARRQRGYTLVEVMSAMTLFAIGAAGVLGMQRVTVQGGYDARRFDTATNIAREWAHRLQRDSSFWTEPNGLLPNSINLNNTLWLSAAAGTAADAPNGTGWITPAIPGSQPLEGTSPAFDILGHDIDTASLDVMFCVQHRLTWIAPPGAAAPFTTTSVLKAEIRVIWSRLEHEPITCVPGSPPGPEDPNSPAGQNFYHFVYLATAIRENMSE